MRDDVDELMFELVILLGELIDFLIFELNRCFEFAIVCANDVDLVSKMGDFSL